MILILILILIPILIPQLLLLSFAQASGHLAPSTFPRYKKVGGPVPSLLPFRVLNALRLHSGGHLLPFAFQAVASVCNPKSKIENPKSRVGPAAILTWSRTRPSDWGSNARFGPV